MKFGTRTVNILKNFQSINPSIAFKEGNIVRTMSPSKTIIAQATISESISDDFCVYDLGKFISTLSLFEEPDFKVSGKSGVITSGNKKVKYGFSDEKLIVTPPESLKNKLPDVVTSFNLSNEVLTSTLKALNVLSLTDIAFVGEDGKIIVSALDSKGAISDSYSAEVGETDADFKTVFKAENLKLLTGDYEVEIMGKLARFKSDDLEYLVAVESV